MINIVVPMAGAGTKFKEAGYSFPKPLIDVGGKPMIQLVIESLGTKTNHHFIFVCLQEHYEKYSLNEIFKNITEDNYDAIVLNGTTKGAACTVMTAIDHINNDDGLLIVNSDQIIDIQLDDFISFSESSATDGTIMTFPASHPKWSYVKTNKDGLVYEVAEKKVISNNATVGLYYFASGKKFIESSSQMFEKDININGEFFVCPVYNELILSGGTVNTWPIQPDQMHGLGTPEDLNTYLRHIESK